MSLWGNATDLSLLTGLSYKDLQALQTTGQAEQAKRRRFILSDSLDTVWDHLIQTRQQGTKRIDIVLDNAGFELVCDLALAEWLVLNGFSEKVVFHPKAYPWFVSDVVVRDMSITLNALQEAETFFQDAGDNKAITRMSSRWKVYFLDGRFEVATGPNQTKAKIHPTLREALEEQDLGSTEQFWTEQFAYCDLPAIDSGLRAELAQSDLVIFKGDLNYRKLTSDALWEVNTPFEQAIGPLKGQFPLVTFRTNKAHVLVGVEKAKANAAEAEDERWRVDGKWAVVQFAK